VKALKYWLVVYSNVIALHLLIWTLMLFKRPVHRRCSSSTEITPARGSHHVLEALMSSAVGTRLNYKLLRCQQAFTPKGVRRRGRRMRVPLSGAFGVWGPGQRRLVGPIQRQRRTSGKAVAGINSGKKFFLVTVSNLHPSMCNSHARS